MKALLFANHRVQMPGSPDSLPCALLPLIDRPFIQHVVATLAELGVREVAVVVDSMAGRFHAALGDGVRWGCPVSVVSAPDDSPLAALRTWLPSDEPVLVGSADCLPRVGALPPPLTRLVSDDGRCDWCIVPPSALPALLSPSDTDRVALRPASARVETVPATLSARTFPELLESQRLTLAGRFPTILPPSPAAHIARSARVHGTARIAPSAWVGPRCRIGADVVLGPNVCLGEGCIVERGTWLADTTVTAGTYVGMELELDGIYLDRGRLYHTRLDAAMAISDGFLLGDATPRRGFWRRHSV